MIIHLLAEGHLEEAVARRLLDFCGHSMGKIYGRQGCVYIRNKAAAFHHYATETQGVLVLTDFRDTRKDCVVDALKEYIWNKIPNPPKSFLCRFAKNELESWLLADREGMAEFLGVALSKLPHLPEEEPFPKKTLATLASGSRKGKIREGIAPPPGHSAAVAPGYMTLMREFIAEYWNIKNSMNHAPSLERCVRRLRELSEG